MCHVALKFRKFGQFDVDVAPEFHEISRNFKGEVSFGFSQLVIGLGGARTSQKAPEGVAAPHVGRFEYSGMLSRYYKAR